MGTHAISEPSLATHSAQQVRIRALVVPREHGAWGLLLVPLFTGIAVGVASMPRVWPEILFTTAALGLFWLRTPVESMLGTSPMSAQNPNERRVAFLASLVFGALSAACLSGLFWNGRNRELLLLGGIGALAFVAQTLLKGFSRRLRMSAQIIGAIGLTCTAPAAYYIATGRLDRTAWFLWAANWLFAGNQIHFVQLRIHAARAANFREKFSRGRRFFVAQVLLLPILAIAALQHLIPALILVPFIPAVARGFAWFFRGHQPLQVRSLGWSEMRQGILFGVLLAVAIVLS